MEELLCGLESLLGVNRTIIATIFIPIFIFLTGEFFKFGGRFLRAWKKRKNYRRIFRELINSIAADILKQANGFKELAKDLNINTPGDSTITNVTIGHMDNFLSITFDDFYEAFFVDRYKNWISLNDFNRTFKHVRAVYEVQSDLLRKTERFEESSLSFQNKWGDDITAFTTKLDNIIHTPQYSFPEHRIKLDGIFRSYQDQENRLSPSVIVETLIEPIQAALRDMPNAPFTIELLWLGNNAILSCNNWSGYTNVFSQEMSNYHTVYMEAYNHLSKLK